MTMYEPDFADVKQTGQKHSVKMLPCLGRGRRVSSVSSNSRSI